MINVASDRHCPVASWTCCCIYMWMRILMVRLCIFLFENFYLVEVLLDTLGGHRCGDTLKRLTAAPHIFQSLADHNLFYWFLQLLSFLGKKCKCWIQQGWSCLDQRKIPHRYWSLPACALKRKLHFLWNPTDLLWVPMPNVHLYFACSVLPTTTVFPVCDDNIVNWVLSS